ncbi:hypothetical protein ACXAT3_000175 [Clostridium sporogenes]
MKKMNNIKIIDKIIIFCDILLIICSIFIKHHPTSNVIIITALVLFSLIYLYNQDCIKSLIYGEQYKIMYDIDKIIKDNKKNDIKIALNEIKYYYDNPNNNYSIEEYLSRAYKLENNYSGMENIKYSILVGIIMLWATELSQELVHILNKNKFKFFSLVLGITSIVMIILIAISIFIGFKIINFCYFKPTVDRGLNKIINDTERKIVNEKIKQFIE